MARSHRPIPPRPVPNRGPRRGRSPPHLPLSPRRSRRPVTPLAPRLRGTLGGPSGSAPVERESGRPAPGRRVPASERHRSWAVPADVSAPLPPARSVSDLQGIGCVCRGVFASISLGCGHIGGTQCTDSSWPRSRTCGRGTRGGRSRCSLSLARCCKIRSCCDSPEGCLVRLLVRVGDRVDRAAVLWGHPCCHVSECASVS